MLPYDRIILRCKETGVSKAFLNNLIGGYRGKLTEAGKGKTTLTNVELSKIAVALMTSTDYLLGKTDDPTPPNESKVRFIGQDISDNVIKAALWGGDKDLSEEDQDALWADVKDYVAFKTAQRKREKK